MAYNPHIEKDQESLSNSFPTLYHLMESPLPKGPGVQMTVNMERTQASHRCSGFPNAYLLHQPPHELPGTGLHQHSARDLLLLLDRPSSLVPSVDHLHGNPFSLIQEYLGTYDGVALGSSLNSNM